MQRVDDSPNRRTRSMARTILAAVILMSACSRQDLAVVPAPQNFEQQRKTMVETQIRSRGVRNENVVRTMLEVPRHEFVPPEFRARAYDDGPLPIGLDQTISQPYIVALMTELVEPTPNHRVL